MALFNENKFKVRKLDKIADKIEALAPKYSAMDDDTLASQTDVLKKRLENGESLDHILPDAYAVVREAGERVLGMRHFHVQLIGGIALHQGRIAEMGTGEGKTLVATLPAYLNALTGKGVHVVTVNDYLATRDAAWMGKLYRFLGLTVGVVVPQMSTEDKRKAYQSDITYCTNNELGFDFLRDNMVVRKADKVQRELNYAIIERWTLFLSTRRELRSLFRAEEESPANFIRVRTTLLVNAERARISRSRKKKRLSCSPIRVSKRLKDFST